MFDVAIIDYNNSNLFKSYGGAQISVRDASYDKTGYSYGNTIYNVYCGGNLIHDRYNIPPTVEYQDASGYNIWSKTSDCQCN